MKHLFIALTTCTLLNCGESKLHDSKETINKIKNEVEQTISNKVDLTAKEDSLLGEIEGEFLSLSTSPLMDHVWEGYELLDTASGDLNNDGKKDYIMILKKPDEAKTSDVNDHPTPRPLLILTQQENGEFTLETINDKTVLCVNCGGSMGDPYMGITIKGNYFSVEHHGGSRYQWTRVITYKYNSDKKDWFLHQDGYTSIDMQNIDNKETKNIKTVKDFGSVTFDAFDIYKE